MQRRLDSVDVKNSLCASQSGDVGKTGGAELGTHVKDTEKTDFPSGSGSHPSAVLPVSTALKTQFLPAHAMQAVPHTVLKLISEPCPRTTGGADSAAQAGLLNGVTNEARIALHFGCPFAAASQSAMLCQPEGSRRLVRPACSPSGGPPARGLWTHGTAVQPGWSGAR